MRYEPLGVTPNGVTHTEPFLARWLLWFEPERALGYRTLSRTTARIFARPVRATVRASCFQ
jgi:hypothetical protein